MATWLADFLEKTDLTKYPIALRTRGGIGFRLPDGHIESNFLGHPIHYFESGEWKPITLALSDGECEGTDFGWLPDGTITHKGRALFLTTHIDVDGKKTKLGEPTIDKNTLVRSAGKFEYRIVFTEKGVREELLIPTKIGNVISLDSQTLGFPKGLVKAPHTAYDSNGKVVPMVGGRLPLSAEGFEFPVILDPDYLDGTGDAYILGSSTSWLTARNTSASADTTGADLNVNTTKSGATFYCVRSFILFDTSGIPDTDIITQVNLKMTVTSVGGGAFDVVIRKHDWSAQNPITSGNQETVYDACLAAVSDDAIWKNTSGLTVGVQYTSGNLSTSWVSKTGITYYSLISSLDISNTTPTGDNHCYPGSQNHATAGYRPVLTIIHASVGRTSRLSLLGVS